MELYLDTADVSVVKRLARILPLSGVTTNPSIIARAGKSVWDVLPALRDTLGDKGKLFAQTLGSQAESIIEEAHLLVERIPGIIVKIPVTGEGIAAIKVLNSIGIPTLGTAVYGAFQGLLAALSGAEYVAPYVNRLDAQGGDGIMMVEELQQLIRLHRPQTKVLAASFRTPRQATACLLAGCEAITLAPEIAEQLLSTPAVTSAVQSFEKAWLGAFNSLKL